jgi:NitT/TauT family transport system permease protein
LKSDQVDNSNTSFILANESAGMGKIIPGIRGKIPKEMIISYLAFIVIWEIASLFSPSYIIPGWEKIMAALFKLNPKDVLITSIRVLVAMVISFGIGLLLASWMYANKTAEKYLLPIVKLLTAIPVISWILFAVLWFASVEMRISFILIVICAPVFIIDILDGMRTVPKDLRDMVNSFRPNYYEFFTKLILPAVLPTILTSWKINLSLAIRVVTMAELVGAVSGVGYGLLVAKELFSVANVYAWTLIIIVLLLVGMQILTLIEKRLLGWRE